MAKSKKNYLDFIPQKSTEYPWFQQENGLVTITILHKGIYSKIAQSVFHKPARSAVELDVFGSFVWKQIDGSRSIFEIGKQLEVQFGKEASPLYPRLVKFFTILKAHSLILWKPESI